MQKATRRLIILAGLAAATLGASSIVEAHRIPLGVGFRRAPLFIGQTATPNPLPPLAIPAHPHLAPQGLNGMHNDSYMTATYPWAGPIGSNHQVRTRSLGAVGGQSAAVCFDAQGRIITVSARFTSMDLLLMDPDTLEVLASQPLPNRASNQTLDIEEIMSDTSGGYFHLDSQDRAVIADADGDIQVFEVVQQGGGYAWRRVEHYDLTPAIGSGAVLMAAVPDWSGLLWFSTRHGTVGTVSRQTGAIHTLDLGGEEIQTAITVGQDGVFIVSDHALYRFEADAQGQPAYTWRETYDRGTSIKPGQIGQGSMTTPTLIGDDLVAICDNADDRVNVLVYVRTQSHTGNRLIVEQPVFASGQSAAATSLLAYGRSLVVENNYGYIQPFDNQRVAPGLTRIDIAADNSGWQVVWESQVGSTTVPKLSIANGLIYTYTRSDRPRFSFVQAWYLTAIDFRTGQTVFEVLTGTGKLYNNNFSPLAIGPNGTVYIGVLNGLVAVRDGLPGEPPRSSRRRRQQ